MTTEKEGATQTTAENTQMLSHFFDAPNGSPSEKAIADMAVVAINEELNRDRKHTLLQPIECPGDLLPMKLSITGILSPHQLTPQCDQLPVEIFGAFRLQLRILEQALSYRQQVLEHGAPVTFSVYRDEDDSVAVVHLAVRDAARCLLNADWILEPILDEDGTWRGEMVIKTLAQNSWPKDTWVAASYPP